ncbi:MAG: Holliday junction resolvase RuvX [Thermodesulfobacteriota bacterium]|nr:Holliday junction resolvase RuvX [Thermodesulfobacteriota bacterium]
MRIMGLDIGSKTIGIAISDELGLTAQGLKTIKRKTMQDDLREIHSVIDQFKIEKMVVGLPINMNGTLGRQAEIVLQWINHLKERIKLPVVSRDERLSTVEATRTLLEADLSRKKRKGVIDKLAAVLILQGYLDQIRYEKDESLPPT